MRANLLIASATAIAAGHFVPCRAQTLYDFGNPTAEEQQYIEFINRARANPPAEGARLAATTDPDVISAMSYFGVDEVMMQNEFNDIVAQPPLAPHGALMAAARGHSQWMFNTQIQAHDQTNPTKTLVDRINEAGYANWSNAGENIFAYSKSPWHGHAGFQVDWGSGTGGMQTGRGHRANIHSASFREIGVGVVLGTNGTVGPQVVTQDFGSRFSIPPLGTGVAYYDLNGNNSYDVGEGIAGLSVNVSGASFYCQTAAGGGWVVPLPATTATRTVSFTGLNVNQNLNLSFSGSANTKADLKLGYSPPTITSAPSAAAGELHAVSFSPVGGATSYTWSRWLATDAAPENCEDLNGVTISKTGSYSIVSTSIKQQGGASFHLENSTGNSQWIELNPAYRGGTAPSLTYQNRLRYATTSEQFKVQVREEGSDTWVDVDSQTGTGTDRDSAFSQRNVSLATMANKTFKVRFILSFSSGSFFTTSGDHMGWFVDSINFGGVTTLGNRVDEVLAGTTGTFTPSQGTYLITVAPTISGRLFPAAQQNLSVTAAVATPPVITSQPASITIASGTAATLTVAADGGALSYQWYRGLSGDTSQSVGSNSSSFTTPQLGGPASYWVRVSNVAGTADSNTAFISVSTPPVILAQPVSPTIEKGTSATLFVIAAGPGLTCQWYEGESGIISKPVGATGSSYTTPTLQNTKSYWVRVSNNAGAVDSVTAKVSTQAGTVTRTFSTWAAEIEKANGLAVGSITNGNGDPDQDGRANLVEYAFGCSPVVPNDSSPRLPAIQPSSTHFVLRYQKDTALTDITLTPEAGGLSGPWSIPGQTGAPTGFAHNRISTSGGVEIWEASLPWNSGASGFLRMRVTRP